MRSQVSTSWAELNLAALPAGSYLLRADGKDGQVLFSKVMVR